MNADPVSNSVPFENAFPAEKRLARIRDELPRQLKTIARLCGNTKVTAEALDRSNPATRIHLQEALKHQVEAIDEMVRDLQMFSEIEIQ